MSEANKSSVIEFPPEAIRAHIGLYIMEKEQTKRGKKSIREPLNWLQELVTGFAFNMCKYHVFMNWRGFSVIYVS